MVEGTIRTVLAAILAKSGLDMSGKISEIIDSALDPVEIQKRLKEEIGSTLSTLISEGKGPFQGLAD